MLVQLVQCLLVVFISLFYMDLISKNEPTLNQQIAVLNQQTGSLNQHFRTLWTEPT